MHLLLIFLIGIFVGISLISEKDRMVAIIKGQIDRSEQVFSGLHESYNKNFNELNMDYRTFKRFIYNGSEIKCV